MLSYTIKTNVSTNLFLFNLAKNITSTKILQFLDQLLIACCSVSQPYSNTLLKYFIIYDTPLK